MEKSSKPRIISLGNERIAVAMAAVMLVLCVHIPAVVGNTDAETERALELSALAEILGVPMDEDVGPKRERLPEYLETVYECWNTGADCGLPEGASDANVVRSFLGYGEFPFNNYRI